MKGATAPQRFGFFRIEVERARELGNKTRLMPALKGLVVADRYELLGVIAEGGQALIARAKDRHTGQFVAVKMLTSAAAQNREFVQRLAREQEAMLALAGTSAVAVLDLCQAPGGAPCLVMELLEGNDLEHELGRLEARGQRLEMDRVFEIFDAIVETLERAHAAGILHRDLKPANIYLLSPDAGGGVRLLDFGLSRMKSAAPLTVLGTVLGSPSYIAPEVWAGKTDVLDRRVDVYSLAVLLYRVLSSRMPFEGETLHEKFLQATTAPRPRLTTVRPDLPPAVDAWVEQALAIDPARRFPSAAALWNALLSAMRYAPPGRPRIAVPESVVSAWRAAAGAFRRILSGAGTPPPAKPSIPGLPAARPRSRPPSAPPRTAPPPPPVRPRKPLEVNAEWLLDADVLVAEDSLQFSRSDVADAGAGSRGPSALVAALSRRGRQKQSRKTAASERSSREERKQRRRRRARAGGRRV